MSDTGPLPRRSGAARSAFFVVVGIAILGGGGWLAYRQHRVSALAPVAGTPRVTRAALVRPAPAGSPPPAAAVAGTATAQADGAATATAQAGDGTPQAARADKAAPGAGAPGQGGAAPPRFDIVRVEPGGDAVIAGRGAPDADVALLDNGTEIGRARTDDTGQFVVIPDRKLPAGAQELALREQGPDGGAVTGEAPALVVVPARRGSGNAATGKAGTAHDGAAGGAATTGAVAVLAPPDAAPRLLSVPSDDPGRKGQVALRVVDYDARGAIRFAGTARPGSVVRLYVDNRPVGETRADAAGRWGMAPAGAVDPGGHMLRADDLGAGGKVVSRAELPFRRAAFDPDAVQAGRVVVQPHQTLWRIARHVYGHGMRYTLIYAANRDQIRNPDRIYPGQVFALPADGGAGPAH